jgi:hypothetical protein
MNGEVFAMAVHNGSVFVTGFFTQAGEIAAGSVAYWDGSAWQAMPGMHGTVRAIAFNLGDIYVAGSFIGASGATGVARWDGNTWNRLGRGIDVLNTDHFARSLKFGTRGLYIGGNFMRLINGLRCSYKALWMTNTTPMGSGSISGQVRSPGGAVVPGAQMGNTS